MFFFEDSVLSSAGVTSGLGLSSIKLESPAYYCTSYASPPGDPDTAPGTTHAQLVTSNYGALSLAPARTSPSVVSLGENNLIRVKRMRRMSSETEDELRGDKTQVADLQYYTGSPLSGTATWTQSDIDQAAAIGESQSNCCPHNFSYMSIKYCQAQVQVPNQVPNESKAPKIPNPRPQKPKIKGIGLGLTL